MDRFALERGGKLLGLDFGRAKDNRICRFVMGQDFQQGREFVSRRHRVEILGNRIGLLDCDRLNVNRILLDGRAERQNFGGVGG